MTRRVWCVGPAIGLLMAAGCTSKIVVRKVDTALPANVSREGVYYALPKTVLLVEVPVMQAKTTKGAFSDLAYLFLPYLEPVAGPAFSLDQAVLSTFGVPDAQEVYLAEIKGGRFEDKKLAMSFGEDGAIEKYEAQSHNRTAEFVGQVLKTVGAIGGKFVTAGVFDVLPSDATDPACTAVRDAVLDKTLPTDPLAADIFTKCRAMPADLKAALTKHVVTDGKELPDKRSRARQFIRARDAATRLEALRQKRDDLLDARPVNEPADDPFKTIIAAYDTEIASILEEFNGAKERKVYWKALFQVTPPAGLTGTHTVTLFSYVPGEGICPKPAVGTIPVLENLPPPARAASSCADLTKSVRVQLAITRDSSQYADIVQTAITAGSNPAAERGFFYRIPAKAQVVLQTEKTVKTKEKDPKTGEEKEKTVTETAGVAQYGPSIAQFGVVVSLPASTGGRKTEYVTELYSATGALKAFKLGSDAMIDKTIASDVETAASSLIDANEKRRKAERDENDELNMLKRQADILEAQVRIKAAQDKLKPPTQETPPPQP